MSSDNGRSGGCLCGAVRFTAPVPEPKYSICHCHLCRRWCGGPLMSVHCPGPATFSRDEGLAWHRTSKWAERGFCKVCGSSLFWRLAKHPDQLLIVAADAFDEADDLVLDRHIYIDAKPARYEFADDCPRLTEAEVLAELGIEPKGA
jgi:hypothetical protein